MRLLDMNGFAPSVFDIMLHVVPGLLIYQILGAIRHVLAHAMMYSAAGYRINELRLYPHVYHGQFYWSYYRTSAQGGAKYSVLMELGPYLIALLDIAGWVLVMGVWSDAWSRSLQLSWHLKMAFTMLFMVSPAVDLLYNLVKLMFRQGDFYRAIMRWKVYR